MSFSILLALSSTVYAGLEPISKHTTVSIAVGSSASYTIFGYTSPKADVTLHGIGISDQTTAKDDGYFAFENQFSPFKSHEACITARDQFGRLTPEVCLAPFPIKYSVNIGPVIMPPTISLDKPLYYISDEVILTGQTIPNTMVNISSFTKPKQAVVEFLASLNPVHAVEAYAIPQVDTLADDKGNFSFSLPSSSTSSFRLFSQTTYDESPSPKSLTLSLNIYPVWYIIIIYLQQLWNVLLSHLVEIVIAINCILLISYIFKVLTNPLFAMRYRSLILRPSYGLSLRNDSALMVVDGDEDAITIFKEDPQQIQ
jgi:hypothetical protein